MEPTGTIIICCNVYPPRCIGGAELIAHYHAQTLQKMGWKVVVFAGDTQAQAHRHDMKQDLFDGIEVYRVFLTHQDYHYEFINFLHATVDKHFSMLLEKYHPDIVHFHNIIGLSVRIISLAKLHGAKTILTFHDYWGICIKNTLLAENGQLCKDFSGCKACLPAIESCTNRDIPMRLRQDFFLLTMRNIDAFISPSTYLAKTYINAGFSQDRFHVVWNGIDTERFQKVIKKPQNGLLRLSFLGYLGKHKGIETLLEALPLIEGKELVRVNLVGDGAERNAYHAILKANGCMSQVRFWGKLDNREVEKVYAETDVLILPSIWPENQPVSITEAMAAGIPVLASRIGGIPELVDDGITGFLFDAGDTKQIASIIERLLKEPSLIVRLGRNASQRMALHDYSTQMQKLLSINGLPLKNKKEYSQNERLIICIGERFSSTAFSAISSDYVLADGKSLHFVHIDWCHREQRKAGWIGLVVDPKISLSNLKTEFILGMPLLVPEDNSEMTNYVKECGNGCSYTTSEDLIGCIRLLHENETVYNELLKAVASNHA